MENVMIVAYGRSAIGAFEGQWKGHSAVDLTSKLLEKLAPASYLSYTQELIVGQVYSAGVGQSPAKQVALRGGLPAETVCSTVNKVCASGMKALDIGYKLIAYGERNSVVAGGMESMSSVPYLDTGRRWGARLGHSTHTDGLIHDGLWDAHLDTHMGNVAEMTATRMQITREMQDQYAILSYKKSQEAWTKQYFQKEVRPLEVPSKTGTRIIDTDEEPSMVVFDKIPSLRPVFQKDGTITAANASTINDGAALMMLASEKVVHAAGWSPLARIVATADAELKPEDFTIAPAKAVQLLLAKTGIAKEQIGVWEINEAFSVVALANIQLLDLDPTLVNAWGGAVSMGHPLGCSGARIVCTLLSRMHHAGTQYGVAAICNGGGGASAILLEII